jgi:uncharacterized RDD family membrane protein YckC
VTTREAIASAATRVPGRRNRPGYAGFMATTSDPKPPALDLGAIEVASFGRRALALLIDWAAATLVASLLVDSLARNPWPQLGVFVLAHALFVGLFGQTLGMAVARIRCVSIADGGAIGIPRALLRGVLIALVIPAVISDGDGRGVHDRAARSVMVAQRPA